MKVSYGPPPQRGVTQLMAVGDADLDGDASTTVMYGAAAVAVVGLLVGSSTIRNLGIGGWAALALSRRASGATPKAIPVSLAGAPRRWTIE